MSDETDPRAGESQSGETKGGFHAPETEVDFTGDAAEAGEGSVTVDDTADIEEIDDSAPQDEFETPPMKFEHDFVPATVEFDQSISAQFNAVSATRNLVPCPTCKTELESWQLTCHACGQTLSRRAAPEAVASAASAAEGIKNSFSDWYTKGVVLYDSGQYSEAQICFNEALKRAMGMSQNKALEVEVRKHLARTLQKLDKKEEAAEQYMILSKLLGSGHKEYEQQARDLARSAADVMAKVSADAAFRQPTRKELKLVPLYCSNCKQLMLDAEVYGFRNGKANSVRCFCGYEGMPVVRVDAKHLRALKEEPTMLLIRARLLEAATGPLTARRSRGAAVFLAVFFGWVGAQKFYLGQTFDGSVYATWFVVSWVLVFMHRSHGFDYGVCALSVLPWIVSIFEAFGLARMSRVTFNLKYNIEKVLEKMPDGEAPAEAKAEVFSMEPGEGPSDIEDDFQDHMSSTGLPRVVPHTVQLKPTERPSASE